MSNMFACRRSSRTHELLAQQDEIFFEKSIYIWNPKIFNMLAPSDAWSLGSSSQRIILKFVGICLHSKQYIESRRKSFSWNRSWHLGKVIYTKYSKHWPYTVAHTIECVCSKINNSWFNPWFSFYISSLCPAPYVEWYIC